MNEKKFDIVQHTLLLAEKYANRSDDPFKKVGSIITDTDYNIVAKGYNKFPKWLDVNHVENFSKDSKGRIIEHAEIAALNDLNRNDERYYAVENYLFVTCYPCKWCCESIAASKFNITKIYYTHGVLSESFRNRFCLHDTRDILDNANIELIKVKV